MDSGPWSELAEPLLDGVRDIWVGMPQGWVSIGGRRDGRFPGDRVLLQALRTNILAVYWPHGLIVHVLAPGSSDPVKHKGLFPP